MAIDRVRSVAGEHDLRPIRHECPLDVGRKSVVRDQEAALADQPMLCLEDRPDHDVAQIVEDGYVWVPLVGAGHPDPPPTAGAEVDVTGPELPGLVNQRNDRGRLNLPDQRGIKWA